MQINKILLVNTQIPKRNLKSQNTDKTTNTTAPSNRFPFVTSEQYLAFTGGYSLDLASTIKNLDKLAQKKSNVYPPQIREWAGIILEEGNKTKETLIDIHKKFYENIKDCLSLDEVKKKFPEFKDVASSKNVEAQQGSFIDDFQKGKLEYFDNDEDLSLQLLKLYWGEGFSINDLRQYSDGKNISYAMKKLNIPLTDPTYGKILKLSDPEYNARLTKEMTAKRMASLDRKAQEATGEPVYIKRGPLSEEHKKHISEGLLKYYENNPEAIYNLSERQKEFYAQNPERAKIMKRVANKAWNIFGADRIKSAMSAFMKKHGIHTFEVSKLENPLEFTKEESKMMKKFWADNDWAKKSYSKNMTFAWKKVKEEQSTIYTIPVGAKLFVKQMIQWADEKLGIKLTEDFFTAKFNPNDPTKHIQNPDINFFSRGFVESRVGGSTKLANAYFLAMLNINREISKTDLSKLDKETANLLRKAAATIKTEIINNKNINKMDTNELQTIFNKMNQEFLYSFNQNYYNKFQTHLDKAYEYVEKTWEPGKPLKITPDGIRL